MHKPPPPPPSPKYFFYQKNRVTNTNETLDLWVESCRHKYNLTRQAIINSMSP